MRHWHCSPYGRELKSIRNIQEWNNSLNIEQELFHKCYVLLCSCFLRMKCYFFSLSLSLEILLNWQVYLLDILLPTNILQSSCLNIFQFSSTTPWRGLVFMSLSFFFLPKWDKAKVNKFIHSKNAFNVVDISYAHILGNGCSQNYYSKTISSPKCVCKCVCVCVCLRVC